MRRSARLVWRALMVEMKTRTVGPMAWLLVVAQPLMFALIATTLLNHGTSATISRSCIGAGLTSMWDSTVVYSARRIQHERRWGTLEYIVGSPGGFVWAELGGTLADVLVGSLGILFAVAGSTLWTHRAIMIAHPVAFALSLGIGIISFAEVGIFIALGNTLLRVKGAAWIVWIQYPVFIMGGFLFPLSLLPAWAHWLGLMLPTTWAVGAILAATAGVGSGLGVTLHVVVSLAITGTMAPLMFALFNKVATFLRNTGQVTAI